MIAHRSDYYRLLHIECQQLMLEYRSGIEPLWLVLQTSASTTRPTVHCFGASSRSRTGTPLSEAAGFKPAVSTDFTTLALVRPPGLEPGTKPS